MSLSTDTLLRLALSQFWQVTVLILAVGLVTRLFCRRRPHLAYMLWMLVIAKCLTPPVWSSPTGLFSWGETRRLAATSVALHESASEPVSYTRYPGISPIAGSEVTGGRPPIDSRQTGNRHAARDTLTSPQHSERPHVSIARFSLGSLMFLVWLGGASILSMVIVTQAVLFGLLLRRTRVPTEPYVDAVVHRLSRQLGVHRRVRVLVTKRPIGPAVYGFLKPKLVLPHVFVSGSSSDELERIIAHELIHVRRGDNIVGIVQLVAVIAWWFHPLMWWANRRACRERERCCDEAVVASLACDPGSYAQTLLDVLRRRREFRPAFLGSGISSIEITSRRLESIMDTGRTFHRRAPLICWATLAVGVLLVVPGRAVTLPTDVLERTTRRESPSKPGVAEQAQEKEATQFECRLVDSVTGQPVAGATVTVKRRLSGGGKSFEEWPVKRNTDYTTDDQGRYTIDIRPGEAAERFLYVEIETKHPDYVGYYGGYSYAMITKNLKMGDRPFFTSIKVCPAVKLTGQVVTPRGKPAQGVALFGFSKFEPEKFESRGYFMEAVTNDEGIFELNGVRGGMSVVWIAPVEYCPSTHIVERRLAELGKTALDFLKLQDAAPDALEQAVKVRDLGQFVLKKGIEIKGRLVDVDGKPIEGVWVNADLVEGPAKKEIGMNLADHVDRSALTDADGRYHMGPLPPSTYRVTPFEEPRDRSIEDRTPRPVPAEFFAQKVTLKEGSETTTVDFHAVPHVTIVAQYYRSSGEPRSGHQIDLTGKHNGGYYWKRCRPDANGRIEVTAPMKLKEAKLLLITNEHSALRCRLTKDGPLLNDKRVKLGTITSDMKEIGIIRYTAPILVIKPVDENGELIKDAWVKIVYGSDRSPIDTYFIRDDRPSGHVSLENHTGGSVRTSQLLPDEEFTLTVEAEGYAPNSQKLRMREGESREMEVVLKKSD